MYYELHEAVKQLRRDHNAGCGDAVQIFVTFYKKWVEMKCAKEYWEKLPQDDREELLKKMGVSEPFDGLFACFKFEALSTPLQDRMKDYVDA